MERRALLPLIIFDLVVNVSDSDSAARQDLVIKEGLARLISFLGLSHLPLSDTTLQYVSISYHSPYWTEDNDCLGLYSFRNKERTGPVTKLHKMAVRTFVGSLCTLTSSIV